MTEELLRAGGEKKANAPFLYRRRPIRRPMLRGWLILVVVLRRHPVIGAVQLRLEDGGTGVRPAGAGPDHHRRLRPADAEDLQPAPFQQTVDGALTLKREWDGHFYADIQINGTSIRMLVDTGATTIALSRDDARRAGLGISIGMPNVVGRGASGDVKGEYVTLDRVSLGGESASARCRRSSSTAARSRCSARASSSKFASVEIKGDTMVLR